VECDLRARLVAHLPTRRPISQSRAAGVRHPQAWAFAGNVLRPPRGNDAATCGNVAPFPAVSGGVKRHKVARLTDPSTAAYLLQIGKKPRALAEGVGFEPTRDPRAPNGFRDRPVQPLRHPSGTGPRLAVADLLTSEVPTNMYIRKGGRVSERSEYAVPLRDTHPEQPTRSDAALEIDYRLRLFGELTQSTVAEFEKATRAALQAGPRELIVDVTDVELIDDAGLTALLKAHLRCRRHGVPLTFVPEEHEAVKQVVALTGSPD
jgi:anti-anti-sigma factor